MKVLVQAILEKEQINSSSVSEYDALLDLLEPKAVMMGDIFQNHWVYRIPRAKAQTVLSLDENGRLLKNYSNHPVAALPEESEPLVYFKANGGSAIQPEREFMVSSLYRQLQIPVPETALLVLTDIFAEDPDSFYAVQASEAVIGASAFESLRDQETIFEEEAYVKQVLGALLTNPSDWKFKYSEKHKTLTSIDNGLVFQPEFTGEGEKIVNVKSILYLLPQIDLAVPQSVKPFLQAWIPI